MPGLSMSGEGCEESQQSGKDASEAPSISTSEGKVLLGPIACGEPAENWRRGGLMSLAALLL